MDRFSSPGKYLHQFREVNIRLKTDFLEVRPIFLRKVARTQVHVFIAMLALKITRLFEDKLQRAFGTTEEDSKALTIEEALAALPRLTYLYYQINEQRFARLPRPDDRQASIFAALGLPFPRKSATPV